MAESTSAPILRYVKEGARKPAGLHGNPPCDVHWVVREATAEELTALADKQCRVCLGRIRRAEEKAQAEAAAKAEAEKPKPAKQPKPKRVSNEVKISQQPPAPVTDVVASEKEKVAKNLAAARQPKKQEQAA